LEDVISKELAAAIDREIEAMPPNMKKVMRLSQRQGYSTKEIASSLTLSEKTVRNLSSLAMARIRSCINKYYADAPAASSARSAFVLVVLSVAGI
jgi:RNA polymerase sigma-70 factor (ECF subfamily)